MKRSVLTFLAVLTSLGAFAQQRLDLSERWLMNERLIDLVDTYERCSRFSSRSDGYTFQSLFRSPDSQVWCDYMAASDFGKMITVSEYVAQSRSLEDRSVLISNLSRQPFSYHDGRWHATIEFDKRIEYEDSLGFTFSTVSPLAGGDFHITLDCVWNKTEEEFRIDKLTGTENRGFTFPRGNFHIVQRKNEIDSRVLYDGKPLSFNDYGFVILPDGGTFDFDDDDYVLSYDTSPGSGRYDVFSFSVKAKKWRVRPRVSYLFNPLKVNTIYTGYSPTSMALEVGVDAGYALSLGKSLKLVLYPGIGFSHTWFGMGSAPVAGNQNVYYTFFDRTYDLSARESFTLDDFTVSAVASVEYNLSKTMTLAFDAGVKTYLNLNSTDSYTLKFTEPEDANLLSGYLNPNTIKIGPQDGEPNFWTLSLLGKAGLDFLVSGGTYAFVHAGVEYGLGSDSGILRNTIYSNPDAGIWYSRSEEPRLSRGLPHQRRYHRGHQGPFVQELHNFHPAGNGPCS